VTVTPEDVWLLIEQGEGQSLEFKGSTVELEQAIRTLAAFANQDGGTVLIGVAPDKRITGVRGPPRAKRSRGGSPA
jgi:predicted HTH transcriptional regulator